MLIVDDEEQLLVAVSDYFSLLGFGVDCAHDIREAQSFLASAHYDIVIADLRLSGIDSREGLSLVTCIRERTSDTRVLMLTAYGTIEIEEEARWRGVDAFLLKPQPLHEIARIVGDLLAAGPIGRP